MAKLALSAVLAAITAVVALAAGSLSFAAQADVHIVSVDCNGDPEEVVVENAGDIAQDLGGWELWSDPVDEQVFDLASLGSLQPGATVFIRSGPAATGVFTWSEEFIFRDDDPTDFARLVDPDGTAVDEVACGEETIEASPTATPEPSPEPSPAANNVPNGGGPPPDGGSIVSAATVGIGALVAAIGALVVMLSRIGMRLRGESGTDAGIGASSGARPRAGTRSGERLRSQTWGRVLLGLATIALLLFLIRRS